MVSLSSIARSAVRISGNDSLILDSMMANILPFSDKEGMDRRKHIPTLLALVISRRVVILCFFGDAIDN